MRDLNDIERDIVLTKKEVNRLKERVINLHNERAKLIMTRAGFEIGQVIVLPHGDTVTQKEVVGFVDYWGPTLLVRSILINGRYGKTKPLQPPRLAEIVSVKQGDKLITIKL